MTTLEVQFVKLSECLVSKGWRLELAGAEAPGIHYNLSGNGTLVAAGHPPIRLTPHTLVIMPPRQQFCIEVAHEESSGCVLATVEGRSQIFAPGTLRRFVAGDGKPDVIMICGYFRAAYGASIDLFGNLSAPIVERFDASDQLDSKLKAALAELIAQEVGMGAMTTGLLKLVLVALLRRSLSALNTWAERFYILSDPHVARAFADMAARPGAAHTVHSLSQVAGLSRSAFMARFSQLFGRAPMAALRELRMRQAASLLLSNSSSVDRIAHIVGYASRSSFLRAFRQTYGSHPSEYRAKTRLSAASPADNAAEPGRRPPTT